jgi:hypothetical protein
MASLQAELLLQLHDAENLLDGSSPASEGSNAMTQHSPRRGAPGVVSLAGTQAASCLPVARSLDGHANHSYGLSGRFGPGTPSGWH